MQENIRILRLLEVTGQGIGQNLRSKYFLAVDGWKFKDSSKFHRNSGKDAWSRLTAHQAFVAIPNFQDLV